MKHLPSALALSLLLTAPLPAEEPLLNTHSVDPVVRLPDGSEFVTWDVPLQFDKTLHVNAAHPAADDANPGTEDKPLKTIARAAQLARPGQRVLIARGTYRERVRPQQDGTSPQKMISYEARPGEDVIISGSKVLRDPWVTSVAPDGGKPLAGAWMAELPAEAFADSEKDDEKNPFALKNLTDAEIKRAMPWARSVMGSEPNQRKRGLLFHNGQRLRQVLHYADLAGTKGAYWVAPDGLTLHATPFRRGGMNQGTWEFTVHGFLFAPDEFGLGYIRVKGLTFQHSGNRFPRPQAGALSTQRGHHWIIEDCTVRQVNAIGIDIGDQFFVHRKVKLAQNGRHIVRRNRVEHCGIGGIEGKDIYHTLIEDNLVTRCGWQKAYGIFETGGMKFHLARHCLLRRNIVLHTTEGPGIWLDWDIQNSRVTRNLVVDVDHCGNGGILIEASVVPNLVDTNVVWDVEGPGIKNIESDDLIVANNFVGKTTEAGFTIQGLHRGRKVRGKLLTYKRNRIVNNVFYQAAKNINFVDEMDNHADGNLFLHPRDAEPFNLQAWRELGFGEHSAVALARVELNLPRLRLRWAVKGDLPVCSPVDHVVRTFLGRDLSDHSKPGPFGALPRKPTTYKLDPRANPND